MEENRLKLSITEGGKGGKGKVIASCVSGMQQKKSRPYKQCGGIGSGDLGFSIARRNRIFQNNSLRFGV